MINLIAVTTLLLHPGW